MTERYHAEPIDMAIAWHEQLDRATMKLYDAAVAWCARHGRALPPASIAGGALVEIAKDPNAFRERIAEHAGQQR